MNHTTLSSKNLVKIYKKRKVVNKASVEVSKGNIVGLLGPNGAGKTTTFYMITGMIKPDGGKVFLDGEDITGIPMYKRARMGIGYLPQEASIFRRLSVEDNLRAVLEMTDLDKKAREERCELLLDELSIAHIRKSIGYQLSGGERRRTEIARALATDPSFILLDEPFAGVDPIAVEDIMDIVAKLKNRGIGVLITDHNVHETLSIVDKAYILIDGVIFKHGKAEELAEDEEIRKLYLGEKFKLDRY
ncbi:MAG TPA: LPS export ABC transporter ATP-binding protein [Ignavibacteriaceae bacterium]|nr:LPS export ABC transporter ATP-binding protein [Ignavibacteriaceae bacterium]